MKRFEFRTLFSTLTGFQTLSELSKKPRFVIQEESLISPGKDYAHKFKGSIKKDAYNMTILGKATASSKLLAKLLPFALIFLFGCTQNAEQDSGPEPQTHSLFGEPLFPIEQDSTARARLDSNLAVAQANFDHDPDSEENLIWLGRRTAYLWQYKKAAEIYSDGLEKHPDSYKLLRHRGHRYISLRQFDKAVADYKRASELIAGVEDEVEPDGAPNKYNIPTGTSHFNIWYHYGLAHYLRGEFEEALRCYRECMKFSNNPDAQVATSDWLYMTLRRLGRKEEAQEVLEPITADMKILENDAYHKRLLMYKGEIAPDEILNLDEADALQIATYGYGVANWYFYNGDQEKAVEIYRKVLAGTYWAAFGYIAAEADLKRLGLTPQE